MSCRVLKRQVEEQVLNEIVRLAKEADCTRVRGVYLPTAKNGMVRDLYPRLGFQSVNVSEECSEYELSVETFNPLPTFISTESRFNQNEYYTSRSVSTAAIHI
jgi:predicted enzyme involved in methoxymalonyl-ACP biosynthesis